eukprot:Phypoly_transcript_16035.p1 GENE.Phypoly_transcript_16035~~Phypoly_transcript_16035.p1  ORF type:complete len:284 (-),score=54.79 Phypoly_transcript_16035:37-840(-)
MDDITWEEILNQKRVVISSTRRIFYDVQPHLFAEPVFRRRFFEEYARDNDFDPLDPENWYSITTKDIETKPGGSTVLKYHKDSPIRALVSLFKEVEFDILRFNRVPIGFWEDIDNRKLFMDAVARTKHFNPKDPEGWYALKKEDIIKLGGAGIIKYHGNSHRQMIADLYPTVKFDFEGKSKVKASQFWKDEKNRRKFFETFAKKNKFDPLVASNWYTITWQSFVDGGGSSALRYHNGALSKALVDLFPEVKFDQEMLTRRKRVKASA